MFVSCGKWVNTISIHAYFSILSYCSSCAINIIQIFKKSSFPESRFLYNVVPIE